LRGHVPVAIWYAFRVQLTAAGSDLAGKFTAEVSGQLEALAEHLSDTNRHRLALLASSLVIHDAADHGIDLSLRTAPRKRAGTPPVDERQPTMTNTRAPAEKLTGARSGRIAVVIGSTRPTRICPGIASVGDGTAAQEDSPLHLRTDRPGRGQPAASSTNRS
jgi:hypothetical protein